MPFRKQATAMALHGSLPIWQQQDHHTGDRSYSIGTYEDLYHRHLARHDSANTRHYYELLRQDDKGCALFFDIEYTLAGYESTFQTMLLKFEGLFLEELDVYIRQEMQPYIPEPPIILDASSATKFSRHYVVNIGHVLFADSAQCGAFVNQFWLWFLRRNSQQPILLQLLQVFFAPLQLLFDSGTATQSVIEQLFKERYEHVKIPADLVTCQSFADVLKCLLTTWEFHDRSIYSKNRLFRCACCTKPESPDRPLRLVLNGPGTTMVNTCDLLPYEGWLKTLVQVRSKFTDITKIWEAPAPLTRSSSVGLSTTIHVQEGKGQVVTTTRLEEYLREKYLLNVAGQPFQTREDNIIISKTDFCASKAVLRINTRNRDCRLHGHRHRSNHIMFQLNMWTGRIEQLCYNRTRTMVSRWTQLLDSSFHAFLLEKYPLKQQRGVVHAY